MAAKDYKDLQVWQKAHQLVLQVYQHTAAFPLEEKYGLVNQFRRAAKSIAANIVEGFTRITAKDKIRYYGMAMGSIQECRYFSFLCTELTYADMNLLEDEFRHLSILLKKYMDRIRENHGV